MNQTSISSLRNSSYIRGFNQSKTMMGTDSVTKSTKKSQKRIKSQKPNFTDIDKTIQKGRMSKILKSFILDESQLTKTKFSP